MDLKLFFSPIREEVMEGITSSSSFLKSIHASAEKLPDTKGMDIAIIGIEEERGGTHNQGTAKGPDEVRKKLYSLKKGTGAYKVVDLGNLRNGISLEDTYTKIQEVCRYLLEKNIVPVLIGGSQDLDYGQYRSYEEMEKLVSVLNIDACLDMDDKSENASESHIHKILLHDPNYLFHYSHLAYQSYLVETSYTNVMERLYYDTYRIGELRNGIAEMEPVIRNADMLTFDVSAIRSGDAPGHARNFPFGLTGEEACQICWYAGLNEKLSSFGIYEYNPVHDDEKKKTAMIVATMVWYFIEGYYHRKKDLSFVSNDYLRYLVAMPTEPESILFYKSKVSEKWWMEVPVSESRSPFARNRIIPCSYSDYETANKGEIPERYIHTIGKMS